MISIVTVSLILYFLVNPVLCCTFAVLSIDHNHGTVGQYFNFDISKVDALLGTTDWSNKKFNVYNERTKQVKNVVIWRSANGGSVGDGHGREDDGTSAPGDFQIGDILSFIGYPINCQPKPRCNLNILSIDHNHGTIGQYFNFDISDVDGILGRETWSNQNFNVYNSRTKKVVKVVLWRSGNGGSIGDGHGRENDGTSAAGDFQVSDVLSFVGITCQRACSHLDECLKRRLNKIEERLDAVEGTTNPAMAGIENYIPFENNNNDYGSDILSNNKDLILLMSLLINIFVLSISLILCWKLMKSNKYSKVSNYTSSDE